MAVLADQVLLADSLERGPLELSIVKMLLLSQSDASAALLALVYLERIHDPHGNSEARGKLNIVLDPHGDDEDDVAPLDAVAASAAEPCAAAPADEASDGDGVPSGPASEAAMEVDDLTMTDELTLRSGFDTDSDTDGTDGEVARVMSDAPEKPLTDEETSAPGDGDESERAVAEEDGEEPAVSGLDSTSRLVLTEDNARLLLFVCLRIASKFLTDLPVSNRFFATVGGIHVDDLMRLEMDVLLMLHWDVTVDVDTLQALHREVCAGAVH